MCIVLLEKHKSLCKGITWESLCNLWLRHASRAYTYTRKQINEVSLVCAALFSETTKYKTLKIVRRLRSLRMILPLCVVSFIIKLSILFFIRFSQK